MAQLTNMKYSDLMSLSNDSNTYYFPVENYLYLKDFAEDKYYAYGDMYALQYIYKIAGVTKTQGLLGSYFDNAGNEYIFKNGGEITIKTPNNEVTLQAPNVDDNTGCLIFFTYNSVLATYNELAFGDFAITYRAVPYFVAQSGGVSDAGRSNTEYDNCVELVTALTEQYLPNYTSGGVSVTPNYNNFSENEIIKIPVSLISQSYGSGTAVFRRISSEGFRSSISPGVVILSSVLNDFIDPVNIENPEDPYQPGGTTTPGGGQGSFDRSSDPIDVPALPSLSAIDTGFVSLWRPSSIELINLYNYMWSSAFDLESFKKIFANPIDAIMGFGIIPLNPVTGTARTLKIGNIDTGVNVTPITEQYYQVDCGTLYLDNYFDTYLEFEPYSTLEIFLPFCGCMQLSADDFYRRKKEYPGGGKINVKYNVDILSGSCVAFISCYDANGATTMTYEFNGNLLTQIPITGNDFSGLYNAVLGIAGNVVSGVAHAATGNAAGILGDVVNAAHNVTSAKPSINRSGTIGGSYGLLANRKPFLIRNIPREAVAWAQNTFQGYPSHITTAIKSINGYTEFEKVYTDNIPASDNELKEIVQILETGVIL